MSSYELARAIGVTQKSAWFIGHRIRLALQAGSFAKLTGEVEVDETFIGGKARNMHLAQRRRRITGCGASGKTAVLGVLKRGGEVLALVVEDQKKRTLQTEVKKHVAAGSALFSDELLSYDGLKALYAHEVINHAVQYVDGNVHTNGMENFWSLLKRRLGGTYVSVEPFHLFRYLDEQAYRFNERAGKDFGRFRRALTRDRRSPPDVLRVDWEADGSRRAGLTAARISAARSEGTERIDRIAVVNRSAASWPSA